jgi:hypothetical protein
MSAKQFEAVASALGTLNTTLKRVEMLLGLIGGVIGACGAGYFGYL